MTSYIFHGFCNHIHGLYELGFLEQNVSKQWFLKLCRRCWVPSVCYSNHDTEYWCSAHSSGRRLETGKVLKITLDSVEIFWYPWTHQQSPAESAVHESAFCGFTKNFGALIHLAVLLLDGNKGRLLSWARDQSALAYGQEKKGWNDTFGFKLSRAACFSLLKPELCLKALFFKMGWTTDLLITLWWTELLWDGD